MASLYANAGEPDPVSARELDVDELVLTPYGPALGLAGAYVVTRPDGSSYIVAAEDFARDFQVEGG